MALEFGNGMKWAFLLQEAGGTAQEQNSEQDSQIFDPLTGTLVAQQTAQRRQCDACIVLGKKNNKKLFKEIGLAQHSHAPTTAH